MEKHLTVVFNLESTWNNVFIGILSFIHLIYARFHSHQWPVKSYIIRMFLVPQFTNGRHQGNRGKVNLSSIMFSAIYFGSGEADNKGGDTGRVNNLTKTNKVFHGQLRCVGFNHYLS